MLCPELNSLHIYYKFFLQFISNYKFFLQKVVCNALLNAPFPPGCKSNKIRLLKLSISIQKYDKRNQNCKQTFKLGLKLKISSKYMLQKWIKMVKSSEKSQDIPESSAYFCQNTNLTRMYLLTESEIFCFRCGSVDDLSFKHHLTSVMTNI